MSYLEIKSNKSSSEKMPTALVVERRSVLDGRWRVTSHDGIGDELIQAERALFVSQLGVNEAIGMIFVLTVLVFGVSIKEGLNNTNKKIGFTLLGFGYLICLHRLWDAFSKMNRNSQLVANYKNLQARALS